MPIDTDLFSDNPDFQRKIASLIRVYSTEVCEREIKTTDKHYADYRGFFVVCLQFHAEQTQESEIDGDFDELIRLLEEGRSPDGGNSLGGNPLRDGVLATAMLTKDGRAVLVFEADYFDYLQRTAWQVHSIFGDDPHEWWNEFLDFLAGYSHTNGKLKKYQGKSALRFWLRVVLWNFLRRRPIPLAVAEIVEDTAMSDAENNDLELNESVTLFTGLVRESLDTLSERERLLLSMIYIDNLLKKDIAAVFQVHPGQIGRWEEAALDKFRRELSTRLENLPRKDLHEEILGGIVNNPKEFSEAMAEALKKLIIDNR